MEREFLKSLAETRAMEATLTAEIRAAEGTEPSDSASTRRGATGQQKHIQELANRVDRLQSQLASERTRFSALHNGWKVRHRVFCISSEIDLLQYSWEMSRDFHRLSCPVLCFMPPKLSHCIDTSPLWMFMYAK